MSLLYDSFGIRRVAVEVNLWPDIEKFDTADLSKLFGALNSDEIFSSVELRPEMGARFSGDAWTYDLSPSGVLIRCSSFVSHDALRAKICGLLDGTRKGIAPRHAFYTDEIRVFCHIPEGGKRNVEAVVQKRLMRGKGADHSDLPGLEGAGLRLTGTTDVYHWHADIEPFGPDALMLSASLTFRPSPDPPRPGSDLDVIGEQIGVACAFVTNHLRMFSSKFVV